MTQVAATLIASSLLTSSCWSITSSMIKWSADFLRFSIRVFKFLKSVASKPSSHPDNGRRKEQHFGLKRVLEKFRSVSGQSSRLFTDKRSHQNIYFILFTKRHTSQYICLFFFYLEGTTATMRSLNDCTQVKTLWSVNNLIKVYPNDVHCTANKEIYKNSFHNGHASARLQTLVLLLTSFHRQIGCSMMPWFHSIDVAAHHLVPLSASSVLDRESWIRASTCNRA